MPLHNDACRRIRPSLIFVLVVAALVAADLTHGAQNSEPNRVAAWGSSPGALVVSDPMKGSVSYMPEEQQYVLIAAGDHLFSFSLNRAGSNHGYGGLPQ